jgi:hypothetical protein
MEQSSRQASGDTAPLNEHFDDPVLPLAPYDGHVADSVGKLSLTDDHAVYIGSTHWGTILEEVSCLSRKSVKYNLVTLFPDPKPQRRPVQRLLRPGISRESTPFDASLMVGSPATRISLLSSYPSLPKEQILAMIPPRKAVDRHVSHFFNAFDFASCKS